VPQLSLVDPFTRYWYYQSSDCQSRPFSPGRNKFWSRRWDVR